MNPLKEHANLFTSGKFQVRIVTGEKEHQKLSPRKIIGVRRKLKDWIITETLETKKEGSFEVEYCTLIARPIEDMTDEERNIWESKRTYRAHADDYVPSPRSFLYALSVGCLPEIWGHCFEDGTVIDKRTI